MPPQVLLVHAPLVGPSTWWWVAEELETLGVDVVVPSLHVEASAVDPLDLLVDHAASEVTSDDVVLVGHSGAGVLLPFIAEATSLQRARLVFVDSGLPPLEGPVDLAPDEFRRFLRRHADENGLLAPWHTWWGEAGMSQLVEDEDRRDLVLRDIQRVPFSYYDSAPVVPASWSERMAGYVILSEAYRASANQAEELGSTVVEMPGTHLEMVNRPYDVARAILQVAGMQ